jgi:hypothetical protein
MATTATDQQKEELMETLKFTPRTYRIEMTGYGGEVVIGNVNEEAYEYFVENEIDLDEFAYDWENEMEVPEDKMPFTPGEWHDCDDIAHENGVEMYSSCWVTVYDENGEQVWEHNLDTADLYEDGIEVEQVTEQYVNWHDGKVVFYGQNFEKGLFFGGDIELTAPFDPKKLKFLTDDIDGWEICSCITYADQDIDNDDYDTTGKSSTYEFFDLRNKNEEDA